MHYYASDSEFRGPTAFFALAVVATVLAYVVSAVLGALHVTPPWWLDVPSVLGIYGLVVALYDKLLWRRLSNLPDLGGTWIGIVRSNFEGEHETKCVVRVRQTWTQLAVELETAQSLSRSTMAALYLKAAGDMGLKYEYLCEPKALATSSMQSHRGTGRLVRSTIGDVLQGGYYTGRGRGTVGEVSLRLLSTELLDYESAIKKASA